RYRCNVDDAAKFHLSHRRDDGFGAVDDAGQIDLRDPLPFGDGQVGDEAGREHAGGVDENVDTTQVGNGFRERPFYGGWIADVDRGRAGDDARGGERRRRLFCRARVAIQNAERTAFSGEGPGNAFADTRAAAGDNRDAILEVEIHVDRVAPLSIPTVAESSGFGRLVVDRHVSLVRLRHGIDRHCADQANHQNVQANQPWLVVAERQQGGGDDGRQ